LGRALPALEAAKRRERRCGGHDLSPCSLEQGIARTPRL